MTEKKNWKKQEETEKTYKQVFQNKAQYDLATSGCRFDEEDNDEKEAEAEPASVMEGSSDGEEDEQRSNHHPEMNFR